MDGEHFDTLVKRLTQTRLTRWEALRGVLASAVSVTSVGYGLRGCFPIPQAYQVHNRL